MNRALPILLFVLTYGDLAAQCIPSELSLNYNLAEVEAGDTVTVTWEADCESAIMNVALISLPPLNYQVQQIEYGVSNSGSYAFAIDSAMTPGEYQFYIEDEAQQIWTYGDTFRIDGCDFPSKLDLIYELDTVSTGQTVEVRWAADCSSATMNISLGSLPPLPFQVQQVDNGIPNSGSRLFTLKENLAPGEYLFYIEDHNQNIWDYGDTFVIQSTPVICTFPSRLELTYEYEHFNTGDTAMVTWDADCDSAIMNISLVSLPPPGLPGSASG